MGVRAIPDARLRARTVVVLLRAGRDQAQHRAAPDRTWFALGRFHPSTAGRVEEVTAFLRHASKVEISSHILAANT
jgi:hypothetical protein